MDEEVLGRYQRRLVELLREGIEPEAIRAALVATPELSPLRRYLEGLDLHALAVATALVARWSGVEPTLE